MSRDDILIRAVEPDDIPALTVIYNQRSVAAGTLGVPFQTVAEVRERFASGGSNRMLVAEIDGQVVGLAGLHMFARRRAHVGSIGMGVDEAYQGQGVGGALLAALIDLADNWYNLHRLELQVYTDNARAIALYERFGFVIEGTHRDYAFREGRYVDAYSMGRLRPNPSISPTPPAP